MDHIHRIRTGLLTRYRYHGLGTHAPTARACEPPAESEPTHVAITYCHNTPSAGPSEGEARARPRRMFWRATPTTAYNWLAD
eukprot:scaffold2236_cov136-Isochrysis_galbana.AAC.8